MYHPHFTDWGAKMWKEEFIKAGYVYFGYISPELSSDDDYPDYIKANVDESIEKIKGYQTEDSISFAFMTDIHYSVTDNHIIRTKRLMNAYRQIKKECGICNLILGGDYVNDGTKEYKIKNYRGLREFLDNENYFPVNGNHDDNSIWDSCIESEKSTHHLTSKELYNEFFNHIQSIEKPGRLYYFCDDDRKKVRYIFLDSNDIPCVFSEKGKLKYTKQNVFAMSQEQIDWLCNKALKFDEEGWDIVFVAHAFPKWDIEARNKDAEVKRLEPLADILDSYKKGDSLQKEYFDDEFKNCINVDFSGYKRGNILACIAGHHHADFEEYSNEGIPVIYTGNVIMYKYAVPRIDGDKSELLFDVVTIDRKNRVIYTTRIGAGEDREIKY